MDQPAFGSGFPSGHRPPAGKRGSLPEGGNPRHWRLGPFEIRSPFRTDPIGTVYQGYDPSLHRVVAVHVLSPELARDERAVRRFRQEMAAAGRIAHPHIAAIHFVGEDSGRH